MIERLETKNGMHYFVVKAKNGTIIVKSVEWHSEAARENGIISLLKNLQNENGTN